jgi:hypothetical protein
MDAGQSDQRPPKRKNRPDARLLPAGRITLERMWPDEFNGHDALGG